MENIKLPAHPQPIAFYPGNETCQTTANHDWDMSGFTKLEKAALMIAQGHVNNFDMGNGIATKQFLTAFSEKCVSIAKAILEEANK